MPNDFHSAFQSALPLLDDADPTLILREATAIFPRVCLVSSLGPQSIVLLDMLVGMGLRLPVLFVDTGFHFAETLALRERVQSRYGIEITTLSAHLAPDSEHQADPDACCARRKVEPLRRALGNYDAWITGVRRDQSPTRAAARAVEWDPQFGLMKVNPLVRWTRRQVDDYVAARGVPVNPLLFDGYGSIGCAPCTLPSTDERGGRWAGLAKTECGIHRSNR